MTGIKGQHWSKDKIIKHKQTIQLSPDDYNFVNKIAKLKDWAKAKVIHKIFTIGKKHYKG